MNKTVNAIVWVVLFIFLLPSSLAVASWNSLPGSRLYAVKLGMEQALVFVVPSAQAKGDLQIAYTERRFSDAQRMLADQASVQGLSYLDSQVVVTKNAILEAKDPVVKKQLAQKYVATLKDVKVQLEEQKQIVRAGSAPTPTHTTPAPRVTAPPEPIRVVTSVVPQQPARPLVVPTATPTPTPTPAPSPTNTTASPADIGGAIDNTQQQIDQTIHDIETISESMDKESQQNGIRANSDRNNNDRTGNRNGQGGDNNRNTDQNSRGDRNR